MRNYILNGDGRIEAMNIYHRGFSISFRHDGIRPDVCYVCGRGNLFVSQEYSRKCWGLEWAESVP